MDSDPRLTVLGPATIFQDGQKFDAHATLFAEGAPPASSFFGYYDHATPDGLRSGGARVCFADGSEANATLIAVRRDEGGIRINTALE